jgi:hypothetical protein
MRVWAFPCLRYVETSPAVRGPILFYLLQMTQRDAAGKFRVKLEAIFVKVDKDRVDCNEVQPRANSTAKAAE